MIKIQHMQDCLQNELSCSQAVVSAFMGRLELDRDTALRISSAFGGGMGGLGNVCGAVTGAFMVLGLKYGSIKGHDEDKKEIINRKAVDYMRRFQALKRSILCRDLLGADIGTTEGLETAKAQGLFDTRCPNIIRCSLEILEEITSDEADTE